MKPYIIFFILALSFSILGQKAEAIEVTTSATMACLGNRETWTFSKTISPEWITEFRNLLNHRSSPAKGFSEGIAFRKRAVSFEAQTFSEYWISRSLVEAKMIHVAYSGFSSIVSRNPIKKTSGIQLAALECMNELKNEIPSLEIPESVEANLYKLSAFASEPQDRKVIWDFVEKEFRHQLNLKASRISLLKTLDLLKGSGPREDLLKGLLYLKFGSYSEAIPCLKKVLNSSSVQASNDILNESKLLLARAYYGRGQYQKAILAFKSINKSSNELATALSELSWSYLMEEKFSEAIGTGFNLQTGGLRNTFEPEAPMVMAMAFNELCQFPQSLRAVQVFRKSYEAPFYWLQNWMKNSTKHNLYSSALKFLRKEKIEVPTRIASEWVRSPVFISDQSEINLVLNEGTASSNLSQLADKEQYNEGIEILSTAKVLKQKIKDEKKNLKKSVSAFHELSPSLRLEVLDLNKKVIHYKRFNSAAYNWNMVLKNHKVVSTNLKHQLVAQINSDLSSKNIRMFNQLEEIAENNQMIEVEIYNGASQDVIWQNAHPDYKDVVKQIKKEEEAHAEKVWDWGKASYAIYDENDAGEIWEDELGSFKSNLFDNCSSKDRYLELKLTHK